MVTLKSLSFINLKSSIMTKLKARSRQKRTITDYLKIDKGSGGKCMPLDIFQNTLSSGNNEVTS